MTGLIRNLLLMLLKVPPEPEPPAATHASVRIFRAARNFYRLLLVRWLLKQSGVVIGAILTLYLVGRWTDSLNPTVAYWIRLGEWFGLGGVILQMPVTLALLKFDYELRWYIVTDRSLRIRAGIWEVREMTMTFPNIQQISLKQGPLQRLLRLADVMVRTAGGGSGEESGQQKAQHAMMHLGFFHGVDNAGEIRDLILERMRLLRDSGLGDPDDPEPSAQPMPESPAAPLLLAEARAFAAEARTLREVVTELRL